MSRELHPDLFTRNQEPLKNEDSPEKSLEDLKSRLFLEPQLADIKGQMGDLKSQINKIIAHVNDTQKISQVRFERLQQALTRSEQLHKAFSQEVAMKVAGLVSKISERRTTDVKIQELIDRHNQVLQGFEARVSQLQKIISEKDAQILSMQATINEAKMEMTRIKRL